LKYMKYGVTTARRGWIEKRDVINTLPLDEFLAALRPKPQTAKKSAAKNKSA
jgi:DNA polymerase (family 10)